MESVCSNAGSSLRGGGGVASVAYSERPLPMSQRAAMNKVLKKKLSTSSLVFGDMSLDYSRSSTQQHPELKDLFDPEQAKKNKEMKRALTETGVVLGTEPNEWGKTSSAFVDPGDKLHEFRGRLNVGAKKGLVRSSIKFGDVKATEDTYHTYRGQPLSADVQQAAREQYDCNRKSYTALLERARNPTEVLSLNGSSGRINYRASGPSSCVRRARGLGGCFIKTPNNARDEQDEGLRGGGDDAALYCTSGESCYGDCTSSLAAGPTAPARIRNRKPKNNIVLGDNRMVVTKTAMRDSLDRVVEAAQRDSASGQLHTGIDPKVLKKALTGSSIMLGDAANDWSTSSTMENWYSDDTYYDVDVEAESSICPSIT